MIPIESFSSIERATRFSLRNRIVTLFSSCFFKFRRTLGGISGTDIAVTRWRAKVFEEVIGN